MKYNLSILERIKAISLIPRKGNYDLLVYAQKAGRELELTSEEIERAELISDTQGRITWKNDFEKEIDLPLKICSYFADVLKKMSDNNELEISMISLYDKFQEKSNS